MVVIYMVGVKPELIYGEYVRGNYDEMYSADRF